MGKWWQVQNKIRCASCDILVIRYIHCSLLFTSDYHSQTPRQQSVQTSARHEWGHHTDQFPSGIEPAHVNYVLVYIERRILINCDNVRGLELHTCVMPLNNSDSLELGLRPLADDVIAYVCPEWAISIAKLAADILTSVFNLSKSDKFGLKYFV